MEGTPQWNYTVSIHVSVEQIKAKLQATNCEF